MTPAITRSRIGGPITVLHVDDRTEFAGIVSHDLRNPLNVAGGRLALVREECDSEHLPYIADALDRMAEIIDDTLALAKQGRTVDEAEPVSLPVLVEDCWGNVDTAGVDLVVADESKVRGDPERLRSLFENLFRNAVEHGSTSNRPQPDDSVEHGPTGSRTSSDGAVEPCSTDDEGITVRVGTVGSNGFYVEDDGPGIPAEERADVFEPGHSTAEDGTGFGLAIVEGIAEAHEWDVTVTEGSDGGARFELTGVDVMD